MGWKLAEAALDNMPSELTSGERCVVHAIAWSIKDATGEGWVTGETLLQRSGLSVRGLSKALERLAERGYELRIAVGKDKHGNPVYAHRGQSRQFRFPHEWRPAGPVDNPQEGGTSVPPNDEKGGTPVPERRYPSTGKAVPQYRPRGHGGHGGQSRSRQAWVAPLARAWGLDEDQTEKIGTLILARATTGVTNEQAYIDASYKRDPSRWRPYAGPPIGTRHDAACICHGSGLEEDNDGIPTGRPCRVGHLRVVSG